MSLRCSWVGVLQAWGWQPGVTRIGIWPLWRALCSTCPSRLPAPAWPTSWLDQKHVRVSVTRHRYATTVTHSLWSRRWATGVLVASEPFDNEPGWQPIPDGQLVVADCSGVRYRPLTPEVPDDTESENHVHQRR